MAVKMAVRGNQSMLNYHAEYLVRGSAARHHNFGQDDSAYLRSPLCVGTHGSVSRGGFPSSTLPAMARI